MSQKNKKNYVSFRAELVKYAGPEEGSSFTLESFTDGILEYLAVTQQIDPAGFEGWPEDGLIAPLLSDAKEASA